MALTNPSRVDKLTKSYDLYAAPPLAHMNPKFLTAFMLGQKAIYDDFISIWLLQSLMQKDSARDPEKLMEQIRSVIKHQPKLETTYMLSCFVMLKDLNSPQYCQEINLQGLKAFPMSWRLLMTQAFVEYSAMNHPAQAASFFMMAAQRENAPVYVKKAAEKLVNTRELTDDDIAKSLELIGQNEGKTQFLDLLKTIDKNKKPAPVTP
ncbi:MAG: hypothetical protein EOP07_19590 [Proteobacteria bacterium]|nr:MAG: hypothetical protein EOP07_19590 [Pseudomonadota bacterium]